MITQEEIYKEVQRIFDRVDGQMKDKLPPEAYARLNQRLVFAGNAARHYWPSTCAIELGMIQPELWEHFKEEELSNRLDATGVPIEGVCDFILDNYLFMLSAPGMIEEDAPVDKSEYASIDLSAFDGVLSDLMHEMGKVLSPELMDQIARTSLMIVNPVIDQNPYVAWIAYGGLLHELKDHREPAVLSFLSAMRALIIRHYDQWLRYRKRVGDPFRDDLVAFFAANEWAPQQGTVEQVIEIVDHLKVLLTRGRNSECYCLYGQLMHLCGDRPEGAIGAWIEMIHAAVQWHTGRLTCKEGTQIKVSDLLSQLPGIGRVVSVIALLALSTRIVSTCLEGRADSAFTTLGYLQRELSYKETNEETLATIAKAVGELQHKISQATYWGIGGRS